jgi:ketosteroid isomerase-like protein
LLTKWLTSWKSGDMKTYRSCYASDFQSKGMNLDAWVSHKTNVYQKSKNINVSIDNLQISADENFAAIIFTQHYSSSILKDSGKKTLELRKINDEWKIYREIM